MTHDDAFDAKLSALFAEEPADLDADAERFASSVTARLARADWRRRLVILLAVGVGGTISALQVGPLMEGVKTALESPTLGATALAGVSPETAAVMLGAVLAGLLLAPLAAR